MAQPCAMHFYNDTLCLIFYKMIHGSPYLNGNEVIWLNNALLQFYSFIALKVTRKTIAMILWVISHPKERYAVETLNVVPEVFSIATYCSKRFIAFSPLKETLSNLTIKERSMSIKYTKCRV